MEDLVDQLVRQGQVMLLQEPLERLGVGAQLPDVAPQLQRSPDWYDSVSRRSRPTDSVATASDMCHRSGVPWPPRCQWCRASPRRGTTGAVPAGAGRPAGSRSSPERASHVRWTGAEGR